MACLSVLTYAGCTQKAPPDFARPPAPVSVITAISKDVPVYLDEVGKCAAREVVSVQPQISGRITEIHFKDGVELKKGDLLFTIDPRPLEVALQQAQANLAKDTALKKQAEATVAKDSAQAKNAEVESRRYAALNEQGVASKEQYDQIRTNAEALAETVNADRAAVGSAEQALKVDEAAIESAKVQLAYCYIHSPIDGRAGQRLVDIGNVVNPGNFGNASSLLVIERLDPIYADFTINQSDLSAVQRNMKLGTLKVEARLPDEPDSLMGGELTFLDNAVADATGTVKLRATIPNRDRRLWPGRFVKVRLVLSTMPGAVLVPAASSQMSAKGPFVYVIKDDNTAELRQVTLGQQQDDMVVVQTGLQAGEKVVVTGQIGVTPGNKVRIEQPAAPTGSPAASLGGTTGGTGGKS